MSGVRELTNAIRIISGAVGTIGLVYQAYDAIKDVDRQIDHLISVCSLVEKNLSETLTLLLQRQKSPNQDERRMEYYSSIARVVKTINNDLEDVRKSIPPPDKLPKPKMLARVFRSRPYKAADLALNLNENAMKRIETAAIHLHMATSNLWRYEESPAAVDQDYFNGLRNLSQKFSSRESTFSSDFEVMTPSLDVSDPKSKERAEEYLRDIRQFNNSAFEIFNEVIIRTLHSESQTPVEGWELSPISEQPTLPEPPPLETHVTPEELGLRFSEARKMADLASEQEFPDAAANYHAEAINCYEKLSEASEPNIAVKTKLESDHIGILIKCLQAGRRIEGIKRLNKLAEDAEILAAADTRELDASDLHHLRRDIGNLYFKVQRWTHAAHFLRLAIFEPGFLRNYPNNKEEVKSIAWGIIQAYQHNSLLIEVGAFRQMLARRLGHDPTLEPQEYRNTIAWCRRKNFKVDETSTPPCFSNQRDEDGDFPLHKAICDPDISPEVLRQLASDRNAINARGKKEMTPLLMAVEKGQLSAVQVLLEEGANLDLRTPERDMSETVLHVCRDAHIMRLLLEKVQSRRPSVAPSTIPQQDESIEDPQRIDINSQSPYIGTALHHSCERDDWAIVEVLLSYGADTNAENYIRETPLILTCFNKGKRASTKRIVRALLDRGANVDHRDDYQRHAQDGLRQKGFSKSDIHHLLQQTGLGSGSSSLRRGTETDSTASARHYSRDSLAALSEASRDGSST